GGDTPPLVAAVLFKGLYGAFRVEARHDHGSQAAINWHVHTGPHARDMTERCTGEGDTAKLHVTSHEEARILVQRTAVVEHGAFRTARGPRSEGHQRNVFPGIHGFRSIQWRDIPQNVAQVHGALRM